jgi:hypothetical protein
MAATLSAADPAPRYTAHEWGTFTSVQGSDGEPILWNPFVESDLPEFVYTRDQPCPLTVEQQKLLALGTRFTKNSNRWLQYWPDCLGWRSSHSEHTWGMKISATPYADSK